MEERPRKSAPPRMDPVISEERFLAYHDYARRRGVNPVLYTVIRALLVPFCLIWLRLERIGREHARGHGGMIVASNHKSFVDPFVIGLLLPWSRRFQFVAKAELFERRWLGWIVSRLGAFPIRRGQADEIAMETARLAVARGGTVIMFPEGTRIRRRSLAKPKRGVGRLALETGAPVLPVAVHGSDQVRRGWRIRPRKVRLRAGRPITFPRTERPSPTLAGMVTDRIWPNVELQWMWLGGEPAPRDPVRPASRDDEAGMAAAARVQRAAGPTASESQAAPERQARRATLGR